MAPREGTGAPSEKDRHFEKDEDRTASRPFPLWAGCEAAGGQVAGRRGARAGGDDGQLTVIGTDLPSTHLKALESWVCLALQVPPAWLYL